MALFPSLVDRTAAHGAARSLLVSAGRLLLQKVPSSRYADVLRNRLHANPVSPEGVQDIFPAVRISVEPDPEPDSCRLPRSVSRAFGPTRLQPPPPPPAARH